VKLSGFMIEDYDGHQGIWSVVEDISSKVQLEKENQHVLKQYRDANEKLEAIFKHSPVVFYDCQMNESWTMNFINSYVQEVTGYSPQEFINDSRISFAKIIHPDDRLYVEESILKSTARNESYSLYYRILHRSGTIRWVWERGARIDEHNTLIGVIIDVTEKIKQEELTELLSKVRSKFIEFSRDKKAFFEFVLDRIINITGSEYGFIGEILGSDNEKYLKTFALTDISWNQQTRDFFNAHSSQGLEFRNLDTLFGEVIKSGELLITNDAPHHPKASGIPEGHPAINSFMGIPILSNGVIIAMVGLANKKQGYHVDDHTYLTPFIELIGEIIQTIKLSHELEEQRRLTLHNAKLASIGELAAGVGHEINNPLAIILGQLEMMKMHTEDKNIFDSYLQSFYQKTLIGIERITNIVKGLRSFARMDENEFVIFNLSELINETIVMLVDIYRNDGVVINSKIDTDLFVNGSRGRLQQVLVNLLNNSRDALLDANEKKINIVARRENDRIVIYLSDTGVGVKKELKEKIFDPFFTTKEVNKGTGIGLALASSIMRDHQGALVLDDRTDIGTTFIMSLPAENKHEVIEHASPKSETTSEMKTDHVGTVLVVDDEENLRELIVFILNKYNLKSLVANNGAEAVELFIKHQNEIDLIVSDINMPELNGIDLAKIIRNEHHFEGGFYLVTGDINKTSLNCPEEVNGLINKPFTIDQFKSVLETWFSNSIFKK
jgi:PAS domain S-box-containing protein